MDRKNIILVVGFVVLGLIFTIFFLSPNQQSSNLTDNINASRDLSSNISSTGVSSNLEGDHILGSDDSENIIVEYASLTCPHCATFHGEVFPRIKSELVDTGKVKYIFRDYPIDPLAMAGSMIAHCSGDTMYFGVIDVLLKTQEEWLFDNENPYNGLLKVARLAGLSEEDVKLCLSNTELFNMIEENQRLASSRFGVNGTPAVFVNNKKISSLDFDTILTELSISED
jgi:Protein-disulfide isomerase